MNVFHQNLKALRETYQFSQNTLAQLMGVSQQTINKWETTTLPNVEKLLALAHLFGTSVEALLTSENVALSVPDLLTELSKQYHLDVLDEKLLRFYLDLEPENRMEVKEALFSLLDYFAQDETDYHLLRQDYIQHHALPFAARHGGKGKMRNPQSEYDKR